jgi:hypothetical protein
MVADDHDRAGAGWTQCSLTEPSSIPVSAPCPRLPTTSSSASPAARTNTRPAAPCSTSEPTTTSQSGDDLLDGLLEHPAGVALQVDLVKHRGAQA